MTDTPRVVIEDSQIRAIIRTEAAIPDPYLPANRARIRPADGAETTITGLTVDADGNACRVLLRQPDNETDS